MTELPQKLFHVKLSLSDAPRYQFRVAVSEFDDDEKEYDIGVQYFDQDEAAVAVGNLIEGVMGDYAEFDPVFVLYRDRTGDDKHLPKRKWTNLWGWVNI